MKNSQTIGLFLAVIIVISCFLPWSYIADHQFTLTGMDTGFTRYGKPGIIHIFFCAVCILFFLLKKVLAKRINVVFAALNVAWAIRSFLLMSACSAGDCPEKRYGIYIVLFASILMLLMTLLPKMTDVAKS